jgi:hypothetical protein
MQPTVFGSIESPDVAERLVGALLEAGVAPEDLSVVIKQRGSQSVEGGLPHLEESGAGMAMVDSGEGEPGLYGNPRIQAEGSFTYESRVGGGISTSNADDDVSGVDEMDDSQAAAEEMTYPANAQSFSSQERFDVAQGASTGFFNTTKPGPGGLSGPEPTNDFLPEESELTSLIVPGLGLVIGDGNLATSVIGAGVATEAGGSPAAGLKEYLEDLAVPHDLAWMLASDFDRGGAVIAVATPPGEADSDVIQDVLTSVGARNVQLVEAKD